MPTVGICNAIWWVFVDTGTINRPLRLRGGRGETWGTINKNNEMVTQIYGNEHSVRRRGRFIAPVLQSEPNGFNVAKWYETQRHFMQLRGYGMMYCNANGGNMQRHLVGVRGRGHDKSAPTPTEWTWKNISTNNHVWFIYHTKCISANTPQYSFIAQMYGSEHSARRRGRFIAPVFQSKPNGFNVAKWCETQRHFMQLRGYDTMNCNINDGNMQRHFVIIRAHSHHK